MLIRRDRAMTAISIMLDVAFHGNRSATVSASDIAERLGMARRGMEPLLQSLSRVGLLESVRGPKGGYRLGRPRRDIALVEVVGAVLSGGEELPDPVCGPLQAKVVDPLWSEIDTLATSRLEALTLDDLMKRAVAAGLTRPSTEPISFAI